MSPGIDFETKLFAKTNAPELLRDELGRKSYRCEPMALRTDPFLPPCRSPGGATRLGLVDR